MYTHTRRAVPTAIKLALVLLAAAPAPARAITIQSQTLRIEGDGESDPQRIAGVPFVAEIENGVAVFWIRNTSEFFWNNPLGALSVVGDNPVSLRFANDVRLSSTLLTVAAGSAGGGVGPLSGATGGLGGAGGVAGAGVQGGNGGAGAAVFGAPSGGVIGADGAPGGPGLVGGTGATIPLGGPGSGNNADRSTSTCSGNGSPGFAGIRGSGGGRGSGGNFYLDDVGDLGDTGNGGNGGFGGSASWGGLGGSGSSGTCRIQGGYLPAASRLLVGGHGGSGGQAGFGGGGGGGGGAGGSGGGGAGADWVKLLFIDGTNGGAGGASGSGGLGCRGGNGGAGGPGAAGGGAIEIRTLGRLLLTNESGGTGPVIRAQGLTAPTSNLPGEQAPTCNNPGSAGVSGQSAPPRLPSGWIGGAGGGGGWGGNGAPGGNGGAGTSGGSGAGGTIVLTAGAIEAVAGATTVASVSGGTGAASGRVIVQENARVLGSGVQATPPTALVQGVGSRLPNPFFGNVDTPTRPGLAAGGDAYGLLALDAAALAATLAGAPPSGGLALVRGPVGELATLGESYTAPLADFDSLLLVSLCSAALPDVRLAGSPLAGVPLQTQGTLRNCDFLPNGTACGPQPLSELPARSIFATTVPISQSTLNLSIDGVAFQNIAIASGGIVYLDGDTLSPGFCSGPEVYPPTGVWSTSQWSGSASDGRVANLIDGSGLSGSGRIDTWLHDAQGNAATMWHAGPADGGLGGPVGNPPTVASQRLVFDLGQTQSLGGALIWNHNQAGLGGRGVAEIDVYVSGDTDPLSANWTFVRRYPLEQAPGIPGESAQWLVFPLSNSRLVRFDTLRSHNGFPSDYVGLSEVRFLPEPALFASVGAGTLGMLGLWRRRRSTEFRAN